MLAAVSQQLYRSREEASRMMAHISEIVEPDASRMATYQRAYEQYRQLYTANREIFPGLAKLVTAGGHKGRC